MTALEVVRAAAGLDEYLASVEAELGRAVERHSGLVAEVGRGALDAGGKRLRPALAFLSSSPEDEPPVAAPPSSAPPANAASYASLNSPGDDAAVVGNGASGATMRVQKSASSVKILTLPRFGMMKP